MFELLRHSWLLCKVFYSFWGIFLKSLRAIQHWLLSLEESDTLNAARLHLSCMHLLVWTHAASWLSPKSLHSCRIHDWEGRWSGSIGLFTWEHIPSHSCIKIQAYECARQWRWQQQHTDWIYAKRLAEDKIIVQCQLWIRGGMLPTLYSDQRYNNHTVRGAYWSEKWLIKLFTSIECLSNFTIISIDFNQLARSVACFQRSKRSLSIEGRRKM